MIATWMVYTIVIGGAFSAGALAAERLLQLLGRERRGVWIVAIAASIIAPVALPVWSGLVSEQEAFQTVAAEAVPADASPGWGSAPAAVPLQADPDWRALLNAWLVIGWALASLVCLLILIVSTARLHRLRQQWRPARVAGSRVLVSRGTGPAVIGCFRTLIVVPEWVLDWGAERQRMIVAHEREHANARDPLLVTLAWCAIALTPWNLALWWQVHRLLVAVEMDCDQRVLRRFPDVHGYGLLLLEVGGRSSGRWLASAAFSEPASFLERRIRGMTAGRPRYRGAQLAALLALLCGVPVVVWAVPHADVPWEARMAGWLAGAASERTGQNPEPEPRGEPGARGDVRLGEEARVVQSPTVPEHSFMMPAPSRTPEALPAPQDTTRVYEPSELDRVPRLSNASTVASVMERLYPRILQDAGIGGTVLVEIIIERDGTVDPQKASILESPSEQLSQATLQALERLRFMPGQIGGVNVRVRTQMPIQWRPTLEMNVRMEPSAPPQTPRARPRPDPSARIVEALRLEAVRREAAVGAPPADTIAYTLDVLSRPPWLVNAVEVREDIAHLYPAELRAAGIGGTATVQFVIGPDGRPEPRSIQIVETPHPGFDEATVTVAQRMRFSPGSVESRPVRVVIRMPILWQP